MLDTDLAGGDAKLSLWRRRWLGRILAWRVPGGVLYIGPHWYCSIIMLCFILGVGVFHCSATQDAGHRLFGVAITTLSTLTFLRCALANPGVLEASSSRLLVISGYALEDSTGGGEAGPACASARARAYPGSALGRRCATCDVLQPSGCSHCDFCQVCVEGFDHHCPWMGKCIGRDNLCAFYSFIAVSMSSLAYIFISTVMTSGPPGLHA